MNKNILAGIIWIFLILTFVTGKANAQQKEEIDGVAAIVGRNIILISDIENQYMNYKLQGGIYGTETQMKCRILEDMLFQNLLAEPACGTGGS